jgi:superfamily II DNA or RNA helicase
MTALPFTDRFLYTPPADTPPRRWQIGCLRRFREHYASRLPGQFTFLVSAGVGSGKTYLAALLAAEVLNAGWARRVVYVCPNRAIKRAVRETFNRFNICLAEWSNRRHAAEGEGAFTQGAVLTYQCLARRPELHARRLRIPTLVIFDEIHHLGDRQTWDVAARAAFAHPATMVLGLSGTPFRSDNRAIPFVDREPATDAGLIRFKPNYTYRLSTAILDGVCRRPQIQWLGAEVDISYGDSTHRHYLNKDTPEDTATLLLSGAVRPGSASRLEALRKAVETCKREDRKLIIFVGGDSTASELATEDAEILLPAELVSIGVPPSEIVSVTSASADAVERLHAFGASPARILVTVNMVSEGVDVPELSAALFLTSITAKATTIQRIGRVLRGCRPADGLVWMFQDPRYFELGEEIEREIQHEITLRRPPEREVDPDDLGDGEGRRRRPDAVGRNARDEGLTINGRSYTREQVESARAYMAAENIPNTEDCLGMALQFLHRQGPQP